jgi:hypothetical protein
MFCSAISQSMARISRLDLGIDTNCLKVTNQTAKYEEKARMKLKDLSLRERCCNYADWFVPKIALKVLVQMKSVIDIRAFLKDLAYRNYLQRMFVAVVDKMIMHPATTEGASTNGTKEVDGRKIYDVLRAVAELFPPDDLDYSQWTGLSWVKQETKDS